MESKVVECAKCRVAFIPTGDEGTCKRCDGNTVRNPMPKGFSAKSDDEAESSAGDGIPGYCAALLTMDLLFAVLSCAKQYVAYQAQEGATLIGAMLMTGIGISAVRLVGDLMMLMSMKSGLLVGWASTIFQVAIMLFIAVLGTDAITKQPNANLEGFMGLLAAVMVYMLFYVKALFKLSQWHRQRGR